MFIRNFLVWLLGEQLVWKLGYYKNQVLPGKVYQQKQAEIIQLTAFYSRLLHPGAQCFDVGANTGEITRSLLKCGARVVAVEPQKKCYQYLKFLFGKEIELVCKGLGEKEETKVMYLSDDHTISSFSSEWIESVKENRFRGFTWNKQEEIRITTLDILIKQYGVPDYIKIDVEGYEPEVLKGLSVPVGLISYEYTVPEQTTRALACLAHILSLNPAVECNYSLADSMSFALSKWISPEEMQTLIRSGEFALTRSGDIYVRKTS